MWSDELDELASDLELERWLGQLFLQEQDVGWASDELAVRERQREQARMQALDWRWADWGASKLEGFEQAQSVVFEQVYWRLPSGRSMRVMAGRDGATRRVVLLPSPSVYALMQTHFEHHPQGWRVWCAQGVARRKARLAGSPCEPVCVPGFELIQEDRIQERIQ